MTRREALPAALLVWLPGAVPAGPPPLPYGEVVDTIRSMAASYLGRRAFEVNTIDSLFKQGMNEKQFDAMINEIEDEFRVELPGNEIHQAKWNDPVVGLSVRHLADMVMRRMHNQEPW